MDERLADLVAADEIPFWRELGIALVDAEPGTVRLRLANRAELGTRRPGVLHGGAIGSLIDCAAGGAVATLREAGDETWGGQVTTDLNVSFLRAATTDLTAEGTVVRSGRTIAFVTVEVRDAPGDLVALGRATYAILRR